MTSHNPGHTAQEVWTSEGDYMAEQRNALTELVQQQVGRGRRWSTREFAAAAIDPDTGWSPSKTLINKIATGGGFTVTPQLVGALAAGLDLPRDIVAAAAHLQLIGYEAAELRAGAPAEVMRRVGVEPGEREHAILARWEREAREANEKKEAHEGRAPE
ncbi:hypothetical protein [Streptomyces sp. ST2-7A]|uniref:hypothetical protein n=1 Tax=Streptomyces sp. ST2-7A TaxID=2907214 RepID=UPI001F1600AF|nr:hypothetical protein [Streptomyces sp. ST2-7A]MCE7083481.1 hypothetical protein [Streptomyces sp. ST2-7A]